jgi:hypothetical protein
MKKLLAVPVLLCACALLFSGVALATYQPGYAITSKQGEYGFDISTEMLGKSDFSGTMGATTYLVDVLDDTFGAFIFTLSPGHDYISIYDTTHAQVIWSGTCANDQMAVDSSGNVYVSLTGGHISKLDIQSNPTYVYEGGSPIAWTSASPPGIPNPPFEDVPYHVDALAVNLTAVVAAYSTSITMAGASNTILMSFDITDGSMISANWGNISNTITNIFTIPNPQDLNFHQRFMLRWYDGDVTILNGDLNTDETLYSLNVDNLQPSRLEANLAYADIGQWYIGWNATSFKIVDGRWGIAFKNWTAASNETIMAIETNAETIVTVSGSGDTAIIRTYSFTWNEGGSGLYDLTPLASNYIALPGVETGYVEFMPSIFLDEVGNIVLIFTGGLGPAFVNGETLAITSTYNDTAGFYPDNTWRDGDPAYWWSNPIQMHYFGGELWYFSCMAGFIDQWALIHADVNADEIEQETISTAQDHDYSFLLLIGATVAFIAIGMSMSRGRGKL